jgi:hypothetical protein
MNETTGPRDNVRVSDVPRTTVGRAAKLAGLPIGLAGRTALGLGKRIGGRSAEIVAQEIQQRTADQIFRVLGELKGGALSSGRRCRSSRRRCRPRSPSRTGPR